MGINAVRRRHGFLKAIPYAVCRAVQRVLLLDITHVMIQDAEETEIRDDGRNVECRFLTAKEIRDFSADPTNDIDPKLADRLQFGYDYCFAGLIDGQLASYCWLARHSIEAKHNRSAESFASGIALSYPDDCAFRYKGFTHPNYRGQRVYQRVGSAASLAMQEMGVRFLISSSEVVNYGALKSSERCGYRRLGITVLIGLGDFAYVRSPDLSSLGICMGRQAKVLDRDALCGRSNTQVSAVPDLVHA